MTKDVIVTIEGLQLGEENDRIITKANGLYQLQKGNHYIRYEEMIDGVEGATKNLIKVTPDLVKITKKGAASTTMTFRLNEVTSTSYQTPYGNLMLQIQTSQMQVKEDTDSLNINLSYTIMANGDLLSKNRTKITIQSQETK
ncbi:MAG: DUF1934 domain-containing protein [Clostridiales bacterium]|nr:DUF1934 domain-containing protein [Clostridiales bacterium]